MIESEHLETRARISKNIDVSHIMWLDHLLIEMNPKKYSFEAFKYLTFQNCILRFSQNQNLGDPNSK